MKLTAELSLYPLAEDYIPVIRTFIEKAREHGDIDIVTNAMSTQICGDYDRVFALVRQELRAATKPLANKCWFVSLSPENWPSPSDGRRTVYPDSRCPATTCAEGG